jgi:hypothetical protein
MITGNKKSITVFCKITVNIKIVQRESGWSEFKVFNSGNKRSEVKMMSMMKTTQINLGTGT